ncbi:hypothetical protein [Clostridium cylindrosporum]|uniref:Uncharacterized protein n=1 Tax=Clostridium cylindrosporum DSM 605 TaxID=1121307 RepID=A0A0J8DGD5_CLOCY|nr:hypothetical protein [Clostridium cylindrosporum]KMT23228.1 hypothetical protein CLCY_6c01090 [Clostridium cylindrosporum DSM 605]
MGKNNSSSKNHKATPDPTSPNYVEYAKNKANENTPYAKDEPSLHTKHE